MLKMYLGLVTYLTQAKNKQNLKIDKRQKHNTTLL